MDSSSASAFVRVFGHPPEVLAQAPGRINLIGEHVDYVGGFVMPAAIDRGISAAAARIEAPEIRVWTALASDDVPPLVIPLDSLERRKDPEDSWLNYLIGVVALLQEAGSEVPGFQVALTADLPTGAGLSSSAALETVTALVVEALTGADQDPVDRALLCQEAEHRFAGVPCGIMDQLAVGASRAGHALMIDCRDLTLTPVPLPPDVAIVVADTRVKHALGDGEYRVRRQDCERAAEVLGVASLRDASREMIEASRESLGSPGYQRARHVVSEIERVPAFATALSQGDFPSVGRLMREGHASLRDDFEVSCPELDALVDAAYDFGAERGLIGARMTGGGFGGSTVNLVRADQAETFSHHLEVSFSRDFAHDPAIFTTSAAAGAGILSTPP